MFTHYKVPNFAQFSHRKYISDTKTLTDHTLKHNTLASFGRRFYVLQGSKLQRIYCNTCDHSQKIIYKLSSDALVKKSINVFRFCMPHCYTCKKERANALFYPYKHNIVCYGCSNKLGSCPTCQVSALLCFVQVHGVLFCFVLFCFVLLCFVLFCFVLFCFVLFCFVLFCFVLFCFVLFCFALLCFALLCFALLCFVLLCFALLCFALLCFALLCFALLCFALLCFVLFFLACLFIYLLL